MWKMKFLAWADNYGERENPTWKREFATREEAEEALEKEWNRSDALYTRIFFREHSANGIEV